MTIDEAIKMYKKITNTDANCPRYCMRPCEDCVQQSRQIAEWLEELKAIKSKSYRFTYDLTEEELQEFKELVKNAPIGIISTFENESSVELIDEQAIRNKAIDEAMITSANAICVGCGYLDGKECKYKGSNCGVSKPMLETVVKALEQLKGERE